jgi:hypothetical protein
MKSIKLNKKTSEWVVAMYCDYGKPDNKRVIRLSYSLESAEGSWHRFYKQFSKNGFRCWQENRKGKIINDSAKFAKS